MENIFENAKFGDKFVTRDNTILCYVGVDIDESVSKNDDGSYRSFHWLVCEGNTIFYPYLPDGKYRDRSYVKISDDSHGTDIIGKYQEPIDEDKLDELAKKSWFNLQLLASAPHVVEGWNNYIKGFKSGYRIAKGE